MTHRYKVGVYATALDEVVHAEDVRDAAYEFVRRQILENGGKAFIGIPRDVFVEGEGMLNRVAVDVRMEPVVHTGEILTLAIDGVPTGAK